VGNIQRRNCGNGAGFMQWATDFDCIERIFRENLISFFRSIVFVYSFTVVSGINIRACKRATIPETRRKFWKEKFLKNRLRDEKVQDALRQTGWHVCTIWECETKKNQDLTEIIAECFKKI
jgi:G:T-mismatch repair DNA endonuclease (very short patch repair protein)